MDTNKILNFIKSKKITVAIAILFGLTLLFGAFSIGVAVGYRKASFSYAWGENYHLNFGGPREGLFNNFSRDIAGRDFIGAHGIFGQIMNIDINSQTLAIKGRDNVEKIVLVKNETEIRRFQDIVQLNDLKSDELVTIIGEPNNQGQIEAKFIRVLPPPSPSPQRK